ncbi:hypothetical protein CHUAL_009540 [Chamberlinius hualienensis]
MAPQREGGGEEENELRPKLATTLSAGSTSSSSIVNKSSQLAEPSSGGGHLDDVDGQEGAKEVDDDLTSLSWLQNKNLLQGIQHEEEVDLTSTANKTVNKSVTSSSGVGGSGNDEYYNPTVHRHAKPPYSFSCLIFMAIENSTTKALPVKDIYNWIFSNFPYFRNAPTGWKNSIRHNLSLNKCFYKVDKGQNIAKGSLWCVDPKYRHHLLHSLNKTPNAHYHQGIRLPTYTPLPLNNNVQMNSNTSSVNVSLVEMEEDGLKCSSSSATDLGPNPNLFPYLAKRLAASNTKNLEEDAAATMLSLKNGCALDIIKQTTIKSKLKLDTLNTNRTTLAKDNTRVAYRHLQPLSLCVPVATNRPNKDHTYSTSTDGIDCEDEDVVNEDEQIIDEQPLELTVKSKKDCTLPAATLPSMNKCNRRLENVIVVTSLKRKSLEDADDIIGDERNSGSSRLRLMSGDNDEEHKKIVDGADALLNLAGIATSTSSITSPIERPVRRQRKPNRRNLRHLVR